MDVRLRIVTRLPLDELWRGDGKSSRSRGPLLSADDITALLKTAPVEFVVADVGSSLRWIELDECYQFWKSAAKSHVAMADRRWRLEDFPDHYFYVASQWSMPGNLYQIVLLERHH